jgi:gluconolactonase
LSPDGRTLYVAELLTARLIAFEITGPGQIDAGSGFLPGQFVAAAMGRSLFDSMAIEADGVVSIATPLAGVINRLSPRDGAVSTIRVPGIAPTNICFGGPDMRTAFITLGAAGRLIAMDWPRAGLPLSFSA